MRSLHRSEAQESQGIILYFRMAGHHIHSSGNYPEFSHGRALYSLFNVPVYLVHYRVIILRDFGSFVLVLFESEIPGGHH
jgi:hypothetical protein